jgi:hypothetical protein
LGYNVLDDNKCQLAKATDKQRVAPGAGLDPIGFQNNGGPTQTIALLRGSPALNLSPCSVSTDQRGKRRLNPSSGVSLRFREHRSFAVAFPNKLVSGILNDFPRP